MNRIFILLCMNVILTAGSFAAVKINEFMTSNIYTQLNPDYSDFVDWIELYNSGDDPVHLGGLFMTDDLDNPFKWRLPDKAFIDPNGFNIIWADGLDHDEHAAFKLSEGGGQIGLFRPDGTIIDTVTYADQRDDVSYGRFPDGGDTWTFFAEPTCNRPNSIPGFSSDQRTSRPVFSPQGGIYVGPQNVTLAADPGATIRYTLDGSFPSQQSEEYSGPIPLDQSAVIRARAFIDHVLPSKTVTHTFVIDEPATLPVICLTTQPEFFFDDEIGITAGITVSDSLGAPPPFDPNANFWKDWERPVFIEYYDINSRRGLAQEAGIKIFGGFFGRQIRQKAFTLFARDKYNDPDFDYPLFPTKSINRFKRFILRCSSNDFNRTYIRDAMMNTLVIGQMDVDWQAYQPAIVYLNGRFWGLYNIREKMNEYYAESNYGIDVDGVDLIEGVNTVAHGQGEHFQSLLDYVNANDMSLPPHYAYVQTQMDVTEFMNYFITQLYVRNEDWLHQNIKCWRERSAGGKWRWLLYDMDWGFGGDVRLGEDQYTSNSIAWALGQGEASILFQKLMQNIKFKQEFAQRFATHLNLTFHPGRVNRIIHDMVQRIMPEMGRQINRWGAIRSMGYWEEQLGILREFADHRQGYVFQHIEETFGFTSAELTAEVSDSAAGYISAYDVRIPAPVFTGRWLRGIPLELRAHANPGWRFVGWEGRFPGDSDTLAMTMTDMSHILAVFEPDDSPVIVISEIHYNPSAELQGTDEIYEYVELVNLGPNVGDLSGYAFSDGIDYVFPKNTSIGAGEYIIIAKTASTYADRGFQVFQMASGSLANEGETLCLQNALGMVVDSLSYDDRYPWPSAADGDGPSIELKELSMDNSLAAAWGSSAKTGGTPGAGPLTSVEAFDTLPISYQLFPAFPNPFNPSTTIAFDLARSGQTRVVVFNLKSEKVETLLDRPLNVGRHRVTWNATNRTSGIYVIRISSGGFQQARKCLLIK